MALPSLLPTQPDSTPSLVCVPELLGATLEPAAKAAVLPKSLRVGSLQVVLLSKLEWVVQMRQEQWLIMAAGQCRVLLHHLQARHLQPPQQGLLGAIVPLPPQHHPDGVAGPA